MKTANTAANYRVELTVIEFMAMTALDKHNDETSKPTLMKILMVFPVYQIEYNGYFGPNVFYTINAEDNSIGMREMIQKRIESYVRKSLRFLGKAV